MFINATCEIKIRNNEDITFSSSPDHRALWGARYLAWWRRAGLRVKQVSSRNVSPIIRRVVSAYGHADRPRHARADARENASGRDGDDRAQRKASRRYVVLARNRITSQARLVRVSSRFRTWTEAERSTCAKLSGDFEKRKLVPPFFSFFFWKMIEDRIKCNWKD